MQKSTLDANESTTQTEELSENLGFFFFCISITSRYYFDARLKNDDIQLSVK